VVDRAEVVALIRTWQRRRSVPKRFELFEHDAESGALSSPAAKGGDVVAVGSLCLDETSSRPVGGGRAGFLRR
jgi:hypothetical protein